MGVVIINYIIIINTGQEEDLEAEGVRQRCLPVPRQRQYLNPSQRRARTFSCSLILRLHPEKLIYVYCSDDGDKNKMYQEGATDQHEDVQDIAVVGGGRHSTPAPEISRYGHRFNPFRT